MSDNILRVSNIDAMVNTIKIQAIVEEKVQQLVASGDLEVQPVANNSVDLEKIKSRGGYYGWKENKTCFESGG